MGNKFITESFNSSTVFALSVDINKDITEKEMIGYLYHSMQFTSVITDTNDHRHCAIVVYKKHTEKI